MREKFFSETIEKQAWSLTFPIYQTGSFLMPEGEKHRYSRESNPTVEELSRIISMFEDAQMTTCTSSGMGAISTTLFTQLEKGKKLLIPADLFGRTYNFITSFLLKMGIQLKVSDPGNVNIIKNIEENQIVFLEGISNPMLRVYDIELIAEIVHEKGGMLIVDSTLSTPYNSEPLNHGADIVIHSLSKFMSGHNDLIGGSISGHRDIIDKIDATRRTLGTSLDPNTAFLAIRGLKTLGLRMDRINNNAKLISEMLEDAKFSQNIVYPMNKNHTDSEAAAKNLLGGSGIVTFELSKQSNEPGKFMKKLELVKPANTFGSVNSLISHPTTMSHRNLSEKERNRVGISVNTMRLSVGIEIPEKIFSDLMKASEK